MNTLANRWSTAEGAEVKRFIARGLDVYAIAERVRRTPAAVLAYAARNGMPRPEAKRQVPWNKGMGTGRPEKIMTADGPPIHEPYRFISPSQDKTFAELIGDRSFA